MMWIWLVSGLGLIMLGPRLLVRRLCVILSVVSLKVRVLDLMRNGRLRCGRLVVFVLVLC